MSYNIIDNKAQHRYELTLDGHTAFIEYALSGTEINLLHTEVPEALGGKGIGSALAQFALETAIGASYSVIPSCPFIRKYMERHEAYQSLLK